MAFEKTIPLNEFITLQRGFDLPQDKRIKGDIPVIASTGIVGYHNEEKVQAPGVVIGRSGSIGGGQYITNNFWPLNTTLWVKDFKGHHPRFVYYLLKSIDFSQFNVGSGVPTLNRNHLSGVLVADTSYSYEKEVSNVIGILDDKINLNKKINQTLEQMSQTLFKSWFVDFDPVIDNALDAGNPIPEALQSRAELRQKVRNSTDFKPLPAEIRSLFPSEFEETEVGYLPAKWIYSGLSKLIDIKHGFAFKGEYFSETKTNQILLTPGNVRIGGGFKFDKLKYYKGEIPKDYIFGVDDIFVSMTDLSKECDSLGYAARVPSREDTQFLHNQRLGRVIL